MVASSGPFRALLSPTEAFRPGQISKHVILEALLTLKYLGKTDTKRYVYNDGGLIKIRGRKRPRWKELDELLAMMD